MGLFSKRPKAPEVAARALCLAAVVLRGKHELDAQTGEGATVAGALAAALDLTQLIKKEGIDASLSRAERAMFKKAPGTWTRQEIVNASWRAEALGILVWALGLRDSVPPYDVETPANELIGEVGILGAFGGLRSRGTLRPAGEIDNARDIAEHWHWRSRTTQVQREGVQPPPGITFAEILRISATEGYKDGTNSAPIRDDLPAFGKAYSELTDEEYGTATSIAVERHFALNWLCGHSKDWDETPTDT